MARQGEDVKLITNNGFVQKMHRAGNLKTLTGLFVSVVTFRGVEIAKHKDGATVVTREHNGIRAMLRMIPEFNMFAEVREFFFRAPCMKDPHTGSDHCVVKYFHAPDIVQPLPIFSNDAAVFNDTIEVNEFVSQLREYMSAFSAFIEDDRIHLDVYDETTASDSGELHHFLDPDQVEAYVRETSRNQW